MVLVVLSQWQHSDYLLMVKKINLKAASFLTIIIKKMMVQQQQTILGEYKEVYPNNGYLF